MKLTCLENVGVITVSGPDAETFLQGQMTADIRLITEVQASAGALCDAKGRVQVSFLLMRLERFCFVVPREQINTTLKRLKKYAMFSKVVIADETAAWHVCAVEKEKSSSPELFKQTQQDSVVAIESPGGQLLLSQNQAALTDYAQSFHLLDDTAWQRANIEARWPSITPATYELFTPQMLNLEKIGGVSFNKGCYVGQEIVARTEHLGKLKRHLQRITVDVNTTVLQPGDVILNSANEAVGHVVNAVDNQALAVIEDRAQHDTLSVKGCVVTVEF